MEQIINMQCLLVKYILKNKLHGKKIAIKGCGIHTEKLLSLIKDELEVVCIIANEAKISVLDIPVVRNEEFAVYNPDVIILSSYKFRHDMQEDLLKCNVPNTIEIVDIYEELSKAGLVLSHEFFVYQVADTNIEKYLKLSDVFCMAVENRGGVGDVILDSLFLKELRRILPKEAILHYYTKPYHVMDDMPFVTQCLELKDKKSPKQYDLYLDMRRLPLIVHMNEERVKKEVPLLYQFCRKYKELLEKDFLNSIQCGLYMNYARFMGKIRLDEINLFGLFAIGRNARRYMYIKESAIDFFESGALHGKKYITVNRAVDASETDKHPKLWPLEYYNELLARIKKEFPEILIVQIGGKASVELENVDVSLVGKTTLEEVKPILKYGLLHIDIEGGLVHLNSFLYGKSLVLFGPTDEGYYGYPENINLAVHEPCTNGCEGMTEFWAKKCLLADSPLCMRALKPEYVFEKVRAQLVSYKEKEIQEIIFNGDNSQEVRSLVQTTKKYAIYGKGSLPFIGNVNETVLVICDNGEVTLVEYVDEYKIRIVNLSSPLLKI